MQHVYDDRVDILLPTYNGEEYLLEQVRSLLLQSHANVHIFIRDDGSTDRTREIIDAVSNKYSHKITWIRDDLGNLKTANNVFTLMKRSEAQYVMLADQDDVWKKDKVQILLNTIKEKERKYKNIPLLICSDSYVTDERLNIIGNSFIKYENLNPKMVHFSNLLQRNVIQGSSSIFNRRLLVQALKGYPVETVYHDGWLSMVAAAFGKIFWCKQRLMYYRQHSKNVLGATTPVSLWNWLWTGEKDYEIRVIHYLMINRDVCRKFRDTYDKDLSKSKLWTLNYYIDRPDSLYEFFTTGLFLQYNILDVILRIYQGIYG